MKIVTRFLGGVILVLVSTGVAMAAVPERLNFQAILLDSIEGTVPNGEYELIFRILPDSIGGLPLWEESQTIYTDNGLFNTFLGRNNPVPDSVFNEPTRWMEIQLAESPVPYAPRTQMGSVAFAYRVSSVDGALGGTITGDLHLNSTFFAERVTLGDQTESGQLRVFQAGSAAPILEVDNNAAGASLRAYDDAGNTLGQLEADVDGEGGYLAVYRNASDIGLIVDGNYLGSAEPNLAIVGSARSAVFDMSGAGDASVALPSDAIAAPEVLDEPGIAQGRRAGDIALTGLTSMVDIVVCTLTIPAPGYIAVAANAQARFENTSVNDGNYIDYQIDETSGGSPEIDYSRRVGFASAPTISNVWWPFFALRTYYKADPGTYVFRLEGLDGSGEGDKWAWNPVITATYFPTSYGAVSTFVTAAEAIQFESVVTEDAYGDNEQADGAIRTVYRVDLRQLELDAARARVEAERAARELLEAQLELQNAAAASGGPG